MAPGRCKEEKDLGLRKDKGRRVWRKGPEAIYKDWRLVELEEGHPSG